MYNYIILDGFKYAVVTSTYIRKWTRSFTMSISAVTTTINFTDKGPGIRVYDMTLLLDTWAPGSAPYLAGITQSVQTQIANLEASYGKTSTVLAFTDPFGNAPSQNGGVYFTNYNQIIHPASANNKVLVQAQIELTEAKGEVVG